jgi:hypothetical protein
MQQLFKEYYFFLYKGLRFKEFQGPPKKKNGLNKAHSDQSNIIITDG